MLSIIMPCRNEEKTVGLCLEEAGRMMREKGIKGEIIVVDNGSSDRSAQAVDDFCRNDPYLTEPGNSALSVRLIKEEAPGYGNALKKGMREARGAVMIIGDSDTTYDFGEAAGIYDLLAKGEYDMVIGNRFKGSIEKGAMSFSHRIGVRILSFLARLRFHTDVYDFHCGLRGLTAEAYERIGDGFCTEGMEFATEMIAAAAGNGLRLGQIPVSLRTCRGDRRSKLRTVRDGFRHLGYIFIGIGKG